MNDSSLTSFSMLLRKYRREAGLSQEELAERAAISRRTISDLERGVKTTPQPATLQLIVEALDLPEAERQALVASVPRRTRRAERVDHVPSTTSLPAELTPLLGREHDEAAAVHLLQRRGLRLLTLVGPGGVGKTRLAIRIAETVAGSYTDGVTLASLTAVADPDQVPLLIARALGSQDRSAKPTLERLTDFLHGKEILLLLDNFEHVLTAAEFVNHLLLTCPRLTVLATSRAPLRLRAEHLFDVPPLPLPKDSHDLSVDEAISYPAIALFVQRAQAGMAQFSLTDRLIPTVVDICRCCDGLPLAVELAAAHVRYLSPEDIFDRLRSGDYASFTHAVDAPARQQTMFSTIGWSYDLLDENERQLFQSLSVFRGGGSPEAIREVFGDGHADVHHMLDSLLSKSLVMSRPAMEGERRIETLETVREFALRAASRTGRLDGLRRRHADYYRRLGETISTLVREHGPSAALPRIQVDYANMLAALDWLTEQDLLAEAFPLAACLAEFWIFWGQIEEGRARLDDLIDRGQKLEVAVPGVAYTVAARLAWIQNDFDRATRLHQAALEESRRSGDSRGEAIALNNLGTVAHLQTDYQSAAQYYERSVERARAEDSLSALAMPLGNLAVIAMQHSDYERAETLLDEAVDLYREIGDDQRLAIMLSNRGGLAYRRGKCKEAVALHREAVAMKREMGDGLSVATSLGDLALAHIELGNETEAEVLLKEALGNFHKAGQKDGVAEAVRAMGRIAQKRGDLELAARLYGGSESLRAELGIKVHPADRERYERAISELKAALPASQLAKEWEQGRRLAIEELVKEAGVRTSTGVGGRE